MCRPEFDWPGAALNSQRPCPITGLAKFCLQRHPVYGAGVLRAVIFLFGLAVAIPATAQVAPPPQEIVTGVDPLQMATDDFIRLAEPA